MDLGFIIIISVFILYYLVVLFLERKVIQEPGEILDKFLSMILLYAGISLIYFSITGHALFNSSQESYNIYIFIIGFIAILWTIPNLLEEFSFFTNFLNAKNKKNTSEISQPKIKVKTKLNKTKSK
jgi:hypothetical protein